VKLFNLYVNDYKNLLDCKIEFAQPFLLNAIIGRNGSGKSNLIEANSPHSHRFLFQEIASVRLPFPIRSARTAGDAGRRRSQIVRQGGWRIKIS